MVRDRRRKGEEKQTERIEVRLGVTQRDQFLAACKRAGDTPSDVLRAAMSSYIAKIQSAERKTLRQELAMKLIHNPLKAAGMALTSLAAFALIAAPSSADERLFNALDSNGDGILTMADAAVADETISVLDRDYSGAVTLEEFKIRVVVGEMVVSDPFYGEPEPQHPDNLTQEEQAAYDDAVSRIEVLQASLLTLDLSQEGQVHIFRKGLPILDHEGWKFQMPEGTDFITVEFYPEGAENTP